MLASPLVAALLVPPLPRAAEALLPRPRTAMILASPPLLRSAVPSCSAVYQADFGRGKQHLSFDLQEGDVVAYQVGTWLVDNVEVGDGSPARLLFARVDCLQIVWTHACEHGYVLGTAMELDNDSQRAHIEEEHDIQFGPEQLVALLPATWNDDGTTAQLKSPLPPVDDLIVELYGEA